MSELTFRNATEADIPAIVDLVTSAYRGDASRVGWTTEADLLDGNRIDPELLRHDIARPHSRVLLVDSAATATGPSDLLLACAHVAAEDDAGYFGMFAVRPDRQGNGLGKQVLDKAEAVVREGWRLPRMRMTVIDAREELIAFYERRGYRRTGVFKPFPYGDERFGIPRRSDLRFEVLEKNL